LWSLYSTGITVVERDNPRRISSSSKSETVEPSLMLPSRVVAPVKCSRASASMVLPALLWETSARLRIASVVYSFMGRPLP